jgi:solute:Na+ symporter, SSS family
LNIRVAQASWPVLIFIPTLAAGDFPRTLYAYPGRTPVLDGVLSPGEWDDALQFTGVTHWTSQISPATDSKDLSIRVYVKRDDQRLYFAFDVTDDVLYGIDTQRWLPRENPKANELTSEGWPWFGDSVELMINAPNHWNADQEAAGDGTSWDMVVNLTKSRKGGIGRGGLLEGEPRSNSQAWNMYQHWIASGAQEAVAKIKPGGRGYIVEWAVRFNPCLEVAPGQFYSAAMGDRAMGFNIAVRDADGQDKGKGNPGNLHHEAWLAGEKGSETQLQNWATLWMMSKRGTLPSPVRILR